MTRRALGLDDVDDDGGFVLVWMVIVLTLLIGIAAFAVDLVHAYAEAQHLQNAVDAAAHAGSVEIPNDLDGSSAEARATELLQENGYVDGQDGVKVSTNQPDHDNPNQMDVTVSKQFDTFFARIFGIDTLTVKRGAEAQYDPPIDMGSPANNIGHIPFDGTDNTGSAVSDSACEDLGFGHNLGCAAIAGNANQNLFLDIVGKATDKASGNAYTSNFCEPLGAPYFSASTIIHGVDGCPNVGGGPNDPNPRDYDPSGEYFEVHNDSPGSPLVIAVYDAGFVGQAVDATHHIGCTLPVPGATRNYSTPWCAADATQIGEACPGGSAPNCADGPTATMTTDFSVLGPDDSPNKPSDNPVLSSAQCGSGGAPWSIPGMVANDGKPNPTATTNSGSEDAVDFYQHFKVLCTVNTATTGDQNYFVHVSAPDPNAQGTNNFSIVALHALGSSPTGNLTVSAQEKLPILAVKLQGGAADFYVARVTPAARDRILEVELFDFGDSPVPGNPNAGGTFTLEPFNATTPTGTLRCTYGPPPGLSAWSQDSPWTDPGNTQTLADCSIPFTTGDWNGQWVTIDITIPGNGGVAGQGWTCVTSQADSCWVKMHITPTVGALRDATTWNAHITGAPVRIVK